MSDQLRVPDWNTQRMWFPSVTMRKLVGHVQGIAFRTERRDDIDHDRLTAYCSISNFPPGWGAVLINDNDRHRDKDPARYGDMASLSIPMSDHPGAIDIDGNVMVVPHERHGRAAWFSAWDISDPTDPRLINKEQFDNDEEHDGFDPHKASASGIVRISEGYVVATLSQSRFLRVSVGLDFNDTIGWDTREAIDIRQLATDAGLTWPGMVDACSLVDTSRIDDGVYRLVLFGFSKHWMFLPWKNKQSVIFADLTVPTDVRTKARLSNWATTPIPHLSKESNGIRQTWRDFFRPSTRWGANAFWTGDQPCKDPRCVDNEWLRHPHCDGGTAADHIELATIEHSGSEYGDAPAHHSSDLAGPTQFVQFRTTLPVSATPTTTAPTDRFHWPAPQPDQVHRQRIGAPTSWQTWAGGMIAAWLLFILAINQSTVLAGVVIAAIAAGIGFFAINAFLATYDKFMSNKKRLGVPLIGGLASLIALFLADRFELPFLALAAMVVGLHFPPLIAHQIDPTDGRHDDVAPSADGDQASRRGLRQLRTRFGAAIAAVPLLVAIALSAGGAARLLLLVAIALLVYVKFRTPRALPSSTRLETLALVAGGTVAAAVVFAILWPTLAGIGAAIAFAFTTLSVLGVHLHFVDQHHRLPAHHTAIGWKRWLILLLATALGITAFMLTGRSVADGGVLLLALTAAAGLGAFIVWPSEGTYALILAGMVFAWAVADTDGHDSLSEGDLDGDWHVVLGDSFISGEGADAFVDGTNTRPENACRRSSTAWPNLVLGDGSHRTMSFACSGAVLANISEWAQHGDPLDAVAPTERQLASDNSGRASQIKALEVWLEGVADAGGTVSHIFISGGGNDAGFADLIAACLTPSSLCSDDEPAEAFMNRADDLGVAANGVSPLVETYRRAIQTVDRSGTADPNGVTVLAATYIDPVASYVDNVDSDVSEDEDPCGSLQGGSLLRIEEALFVNRFRERINSQIIAAVAELKSNPVEGTSGRYWVEALSLEHALNDRSVCSDDPGINWIDLRPADDNLARKITRGGVGIDWSASQLLPTNWVNSSLHPNESGHRSMAVVANSCLDALRDTQRDAISEAPETTWGTDWVCADPMPDFVLPAGSACVKQGKGGAAPFCAETTAHETTREVRAAIQATAGRRLGMGLGLAALAGFLFAAFGALPRVPAPVKAPPTRRRLRKPSRQRSTADGPTIIASDNRDTPAGSGQRATG